MLGNVKWGYTDVWCNMTTAGGPDGCRALRLLLSVTMADNSTFTLGSTDTPGAWSVRQGPVTWDHLFHGETYNASLELAGWTTPGAAGVAAAADPSWMPARVMAPPGTGLGLPSPARLPPIRALEHFAPVSVTALGGDAWLYDFGQNMAGMVTLTLPANTPAGRTVRLAHAEMRESAVGALQNGYCSPNPAGPPLRLEPCAPHQTYGSGHLIADRYIGDFNCANATNIYITAGGAAEYTPLFSYAGFRYVQLAGLGLDQPPNLTAHFAHTDVREVGQLTLPSVPAVGTGTSGTPDVLNGIHRLTRYAQLSNLWSIPTDCPQRERRGWMGDAQVSSDGAMRAFDMQAFYRTFLTHIRDDQLWGCASTPGHACTPAVAASANGSVADVVPFDGIGGWPGCPVWQVAYIVLARNSWRHYADASLLAVHYPGLQALLAYFERSANSSSGLLETACYGDWIDAGGHITPPGSVTSFYYVLAFEYMAEIASALGLTADAAKYTAQHAAGQRAYHTRYYNATARGYTPVAAAPRGSQTANAMALALGAPPDAATAAIIADALAWDVNTLRTNHTSGGIIGQAWTAPALAATGRSDLVLAMLRQDTLPSFGFMLAHNQTTLCESWNCTAFQPTSSSHNHIMFGAFDAWLTTAVGGLDTLSNGTSSGWRDMVVSPDAAAVAELGAGGYALSTRFGPAALSWAMPAGGTTLTLNVTVPLGSAAHLRPPAMLPAGRNSAPKTVARVVWLGAAEAKGTDADRNAGSEASPVELWVAGAPLGKADAGLGLASGWGQLPAVTVAAGRLDAGRHRVVVEYV